MDGRVLELLVQSPSALPAKQSRKLDRAMGAAIAAQVQAVPLVHGPGRKACRVLLFKLDKLKASWAVLPQLSSQKTHVER